MKSKIDTIVRKAEESKYAPTGTSFFRAGIAAIPVVGGALDHLIFDKSEEIRSRNIEASINSLESKYEKLKANAIDLDWFASGEAVSLFKVLISLIEYEDSTDKIDAVSQVYAVSSLKMLSDDPQKALVMRKVSELTSVQRKLFIHTSNLIPEERQFTSNALISKATLIWIDNVVDSLNKEASSNPNFAFWQEGFNVEEQLELLKAIGLLDRQELMISNTHGYRLSILGKIVKLYLDRIS